MLIQKIEIRSKKQQQDLKITVGMSMCGERIKITHKNNKHADCPMCEAEEEWEHARMCNENKQKRDEWT